MSPRKHTIEATEPMPTYNEPGAVPTHATEDALRRSQAAEHVGRYVAFDHGSKRVVGLCVASEPCGKDADTGIPDFRVSVQSLRDESRTIEVKAVEQYCHFHADLAEARRITEGLGE